MSSTTNNIQAPIKYPWWYGGVGGLVACMSTHPLDLAKVRLQTKTHTTSENLVTIIPKIVKKDGFFTLYNGLSAAILRQLTYTMSRFGIYALLKENLVPANRQNDSRYLLSCSVISGACGGLIGNPADVINIRMQNDKSLPISQQRNYKNCIDGIIKIYKNESIKTFFNGWKPNLIRGVLMTSSQLVTYDIMKHYLTDYFHMNPKNKSTHFSASLLAGLVATTVCSPADVIKTIIMNSSKKHESATKLMRESIKNEGIGFIFRGWVPSFIRLGPFTIIIFLTVEQLKKYKIGMHEEKKDSF